MKIKTLKNKILFAAVSALLGVALAGCGRHAENGNESAATNSAFGQQPSGTNATNMVNTNYPASTNQ